MKTTPLTDTPNGSPKVRPRHQLENQTGDFHGTPSSEDGASAIRPSHEEISNLAYQHWETRGGAEGSAHEDWLRAERELSSQIT